MAVYMYICVDPNQKEFLMGGAMRLVFVIAAVVYCVVCASGAKCAHHSSQQDSDSARYSIISDESMGSIKRSVDVRLPDRVTVEVLEQYADQIYRKGYDRTFITYYLSGMETGGGAWATSHYDPNLEVKIHGATIDEAGKLNNLSVQGEGREVIGSWMVSGILSRRIDIYEESGECFMSITYKDGSSSVKEIVQSRRGRFQCYTEQGNRHGEYYLVNSRGQIEVRDEIGVIDRGDPVDR